MEDFVAVIIVGIIFAIPFTAIVTNHFQKQSKFKLKMLKEELALEKLKHENFLLETERMKLELQQMEKDNSLITKK
ncbi:hypothetical protein [Bacillus sp. B1-b2]|uniref:hypothetical protein n=1 Tax=Bacillus sp. B1-b2 TaxID=2653201 RepID=UPI001261ACAB|nr:hypothetical protein [Bacillus sp. B1-b2]KAB7666070.1 hypothetical protein F9279_18815 [Bacillus sp. B1-b2]